MILTHRVGYSSGTHRGEPGQSRWEHADVAQLVAHHLAKVRVAGSNPVVRSVRPTTPGRPTAGQRESSGATNSDRRPVEPPRYEARRSGRVA